MSSATLQIVRYSPPWDWTWRLRDGGELLAESTLDPLKSGHQMLLEREALARRMPGVRLRDEMTAHLRALLTEELAAALEGNSARTLIVAGPRSTQVALSLPFELLFGRDDPDAVVVRAVVPERAHDVPRASAERMVTAFPLTPDQHYLPLHLEAELLAERARSAGVSLDELFVCFTAEDVLHATRGASIVHLAGHGMEGALRCEWRGRSASVLTASDLVDAWRERAPNLVVLGFCESSSERDELRWTRVAARGDLSLRDLARIVPATATPSASMAFDLVAALPTAAIGLRTNADDTEARRFLDAFYGAHLNRGLTLERAYARALAECGFLDGVGLPVPVLYSSADHELIERRAATGAADAPVRCVSPVERRCLNLLYQATAPLGIAIDGAWGCRVSGANAGLRSGLASGMQAATEVWRGIQGVAGPHPALAVGAIDEAHWEIVSRPVIPAEPLPRIVRVDLDRWPRSVTIGELLAARADASLDRLQLLARATCDVPALVAAVLATGVDATAGALHERMGDGAATDWELARELLELLPDEVVGPVRDWAERRWRVVESIGQTAIDVAAAFAVVPEDESLVDPGQPILTAIYRRTGLDPAEHRSALREMAEAHIISFGTGLLEGELAETMDCDMLTAQRGWHHRSGGAAAALAECQVERELDLLPSIDFIESFETPRLAWLAERCLECDHPRLPSLLRELAGREEGAEIARSLANRRESGQNRGRPVEVVKPNEDPRWGSWDELIAKARFEEAAELLDAIEASAMATDHPLRIDANRLITRMADPDQEALLRDAEALEERLAAEAPPEERSSALVELLLVTRQAAASALQRLGRPGEAAGVLLGHFEETLKLGSQPSACIYAGIHAITMLCLNDEADRARPVCDLLLPLVANLAPSPPTVLVHTVEIELLLTEGRRVHAAAAAEDLLQEIGEWKQPRPDQVRGALGACAGGLMSTARGIALFAAIDLADGHHDMLADERMSSFADAWRGIEPDAVLAAADELCETIPAALRVLDLSPQRFRDGVRAFVDAYAELAASSPAGRIFGERGAAVLLARAAAGCPLSGQILDVAGLTAAGEPKTDEGTNEDDGGEVGGSGRTYDAAGIAREHPRLKEVFSDKTPEVMRAAMSTLFPALHGYREARLVWAAAVLGVEGDGPAPASYAFLAVIRGDIQAAWTALRRERNLGMTVSICIAIEECCLWRRDEDREPEPISHEMSSLALSTWESFLEQAASDPPSASAVYLGLASAFGSTHVLVAALLEARRRDTSLAQLAGADEASPVSQRVFELLQANEGIQLALAEKTTEREPEHSDEALELLELLAGGEHVELAQAARASRLAAALRLGRRDLMAEALDQVLASLDEIDPRSMGRLTSLNLVALAALELDRPGDAVGAANDLLDHPVVQEMPKSRYGAFRLTFRALLADEQTEKAAETLAQAGADLGFSVACAMLLEAPVALEPDMAERFAAVMLPLARVEEANADDAPLRSARMTFLERIGDTEAWTPVRLATEATLVKT